MDGSCSKQSVEVRKRRKADVVVQVLYTLVVTSAKEKIYFSNVPQQGRFLFLISHYFPMSPPLHLPSHE